MVWITLPITVVMVTETVGVVVWVVVVRLVVVTAGRVLTPAVTPKQEHADEYLLVLPQVENVPGIVDRDDVEGH